jgi:hypothetical protein
LRAGGRRGRRSERLRLIHDVKGTERPVAGGVLLGPSE